MTAATLAPDMFILDRLGIVHSTTTPCDDARAAITLRPRLVPVTEVQILAYPRHLHRCGGCFPDDSHRRTQVTLAAYRAGAAA